MRKDNEALKEIGKGFINLGNIIGGLSFVNIFLQKSFNNLDIFLVLYLFIIFYLSGFAFIKGGTND